MVIPAGAPEFSTVTASAQNISTTMSHGNLYLFTSNTTCWIQQGSNPTATAGAGSILIPAGTTILLHGDQGTKCSVIRDAADGKATLVIVRRSV
jgi:hypothetical protein